MIYYTIETSTQFTTGQAVQLSSTNTIEVHTTGDVLGVVLSSLEVDDNFKTKIYAAGGGGTYMILGADWSGHPTRFKFSNSHVIPSSSNGSGWLIPEDPITPKVAGDLVLGAIYK